MQTGTADYFEHILETLCRRRVPKHYVKIAVDSDKWSRRDAKTEARGFEIVDYRGLSSLVLENELRIYFVANNEYHSYIHQSFSRIVRLPGSCVVSVIHDVCCAMLLKHLSFNGLYTFSPDQFMHANKSQFGEKTQKIVDDRNAGNIPEIFEFVSHAQGFTLAASDEIWTHSRFGALKFVLESDIPPAEMPTIRYGRHPVFESDASATTQAEELSPEDAKLPGKIRFGIFGWVSPSKRIYEALNALALVLDRLPCEEQAKVEMVVVGKLPPHNIYDPVRHAKSLGLEGHCRFFDYVNAKRFRALLESCDCVLNLRFPSCGESSGAAAHAMGGGVRVIMSRQQAFSEEPASAFVEPLPKLEEMALATEMMKVIAGTDTKQAALGTGSFHEAGLDEVLAEKIWRRVVTYWADHRAKRVAASSSPIVLH